MRLVGDRETAAFEDICHRIPDFYFVRVGTQRAVLDVDDKVSWSTRVLLPRVRSLSDWSP
jgi:hypothetical protein